jgi:hypothetical protein
MCTIAIKEASRMGHRTIRPEHALLALASIEGESFFSVKLSALEKDALASYVAGTTSKSYPEPLMDRLQCALHDFLGSGVPPYSRAFFTVMHCARKRSRTAKSEITYRDLCRALLLDLPENATAHEALKRAGLDARLLKLSLESDG